MMLSALLGSEAGALYGAAGIMAYNILFFTYVQHLFDPEAKVSIKAFLTPTNITTAIMVVMLVTGLRLPAILESFCKAVGNTTTPLALMTPWYGSSRPCGASCSRWASWRRCTSCRWTAPCAWRS